MESLDFLLFAEFLGKPAWVWWLFIGLVAALLAFDLGVLHRKQREIEVGESLWLSAGYIAAALLFGSWIWSSMGRDAGMAYMTGFFIEKSLALDNVFVISLIFAYFAVPRVYQHRDGQPACCEGQNGRHHQQVVSQAQHGRQVGQLTSGIASAPLFLVLNNSISSRWGGKTVVPSVMHVDYVRVWRR